MNDELWSRSATELTGLIEAKEASPVEITESVLSHIDRHNSKVRAFLTVTDELALEEARAAEQRAMAGERISPLDGIPYSIKDLEATAGIRTTYGTKFHEHHVPDVDSITSARLRASGGVLLGKTNTPAYGYKDMAENLLGEPCVNPWNLRKTSGGSSGGAASAVAAGFGPVAQGSDGAGSIRTPSSLCGVVGMKPSFGRVPVWPGGDYWGHRVHNGPIARTVADAALLLSVLAGPDPRDPISVDQPWPADFRPDPSGAPLRGLRIAFSPDLGYGQVEPEIAELAASALPVFTSYGALVEHRDPSWANPGPFHRVIYHSGLAVRAEREYEQHPEWVDEWLTEIVLEGRGLSAVELKKAETERGQLYDSAAEFFTEFDLLVTPQLPFTAWDAGSGRGRTTVGSLQLYPDYRRSFLCYPFNLTGQPAITLPCGWTAEGMPVGLQIVGRWHRDDTVLHAAAAFEAARPFADRWPQLA
jgi:Asp-tRNA(Asn)/Glu-tRNA(Gln) amidotransferase A subunit family amidase